MGITSNVAKFDHWIRTSFVELNTELEGVYWTQENRADVRSGGEKIKQQLLDDGRHYIVDLLAEGNTDEGFDSNFDLLGNVGLYMAACRRHELTEPSREHTSPLKEASALALQLGASLGVTPRFATSHLSTHNLAIHGIYKTFTSLDAEYVFLEYNTRGVFAYKRAADALLRALPLERYAVRKPGRRPFFLLRSAILQTASCGAARIPGCKRRRFRRHQRNRHALGPVPGGQSFLFAIAGRQVPVYAARRSVDPSRCHAA
jgi:hypothetical protein